MKPPTCNLNAAKRKGGYFILRITNFNDGVNLAGKLVSDNIVVWCPSYRKCPENTRFWSVCEH